MTVSEKIPLWLDCDPGQDDIVAITLAAFNPHINLLGISTTHGNSSLENTTSNTLRYLTALGKTEIPVFPVSATPLDRETDYCPEVHGTTGLNGSDLLPQAAVEPHKTEDFFPHLKSLIEQYEGEISIAAIGPLTNMAVFFRRYPETKKKIKFLTIMGAAFTIFNRKSAAEFNISCDPTAAKEIFSDPILSKVILLAPLDLTQHARATFVRRERILNSGATKSTFRSLIHDLLDSMNERMKLRFGEGYPGPSLHDPVAIAALLQFYKIDSSIKFEYHKYNIITEIGGERDGATTKSDPVKEGTTVLESMDVEQFWELVFQAYDLADKNSTLLS